MPSDPHLAPVAPTEGEQELVLRGRVITGGSEAPGSPGMPGAPQDWADAVVVVRGDRILAVQPAEGASPEVLARARRVPLVVPGLVDAHCHGGLGGTYGEDPAEARRIAAFWAGQGTTSPVASLVTAPEEVLTRQIRALAPLVAQGVLAGIHLEGPFLCADMRGAQDPDAMVPGRAELAQAWFHAGGGAVRSMTVAPEVAGASEVLAVCREHGVLPSVGHTGATSEQTRALLRGAHGDGPWGGTHVFNRMPPLSHRDPGPLPVLMERARRRPEQTFLEVIADGVHLDPEIVRWLFTMMEGEGLVLITDSMAAAGMADGRYTLGAMDVEVRDGQARLAGAVENRGALAGGTSTLLQDVRRCSAWGIPLPQAVRAATATPARGLGLDDVGRLAPGLRADLLVLDEELGLREVFRGGRAVQLAPPQEPFDEEES